MKEKDPEIDFDAHIMPAMKDLAIDTLTCTDLNPKGRENNFELFGFDFMIDEDYRVWLIEVNTNPYLGKPNEYISELLPEMVSEMFTIVLDPIY